MILSSNLYARDFAEAQVQYITDSEDNKILKRNWDESSHHGSIYIKVRLSNYREDWHLGGFSISDLNRPYISWPELGADCKVFKFKGHILPPLADSESYLTFQLKGPSCERFINIFNYFGVTISFYEVKSITDDQHTRVLRLFINDAVQVPK